MTSSATLDYFSLLCAMTLDFPTPKESAMFPRLEFPDSAGASDFMTTALDVEFDRVRLTHFERACVVQMIMSGELSITSPLRVVLIAHLVANDFTRIEAETKIMNLPDDFLDHIGHDAFSGTIVAGGYKPADLVTSLANKIIDHWNAELQSATC